MTDLFDDIYGPQEEVKIEILLFLDGLRVVALVKNTLENKSCTLSKHRLELSHFSYNYDGRMISVLRIGSNNTNILQNNYNETQRRTIRSL